MISSINKKTNNLSVENIIFNNKEFSNIKIISSDGKEFYSDRNILGQSSFFFKHLDKKITSVDCSHPQNILLIYLLFIYKKIFQVNTLDDLFNATSLAIEFRDEIFFKECLSNYDPDNFTSLGAEKAIDFLEELQFKDEPTIHRLKNKKPWDQRCWNDAKFIILTIIFCFGIPLTIIAFSYLFSK